MQRLLFIIGLLAVGGCATDEAARSDGAQDAPRIIQETKLPLSAVRQGAQPAERRWTFTTQSIQGSLDASGAWSVRAEIDQPVTVADNYAWWARDGRPLTGCPFLAWEKGGYACGIYETRPGVCRDYEPASSQICPLWKA